MKYILKEIVSSEAGTISSIDCINFTSTVSKLGKSDAQKALEKFLSSKWLKEVHIYINIYIYVNVFFFTHTIFSFSFTIVSSHP